MNRTKTADDFKMPPLPAKKINVKNEAIVKNEEYLSEGKEMTSIVFVKKEDSCGEAKPKFVGNKTKEKGGSKKEVNKKKVRDAKLITQL